VVVYVAIALRPVVIATLVSVERRGAVHDDIVSAHVVSERSPITRNSWSLEADAYVVESSRNSGSVYDVVGNQVARAPACKVDISRPLGGLAVPVADVIVALRVAGLLVEDAGGIVVVDDVPTGGHAGAALVEPDAVTAPPPGAGHAAAVDDVVLDGAVGNMVGEVDMVAAPYLDSGRVHVLRHVAAIRDLVIVDAHPVRYAGSGIGVEDGVLAAMSRLVARDPAIISACDPDPAPVHILDVAILDQ